MGRGLGPIQRHILDRLADSDGGLFVSDLCTDPDDPLERQRYVKAIRSLSARGLVTSYRKGNPNRTTTDYRPIAGWPGTWHGEDVERQVNETYVIARSGDPAVGRGRLSEVMQGWPDLD